MGNQFQFTDWTISSSVNEEYWGYASKATWDTSNVGTKFFDTGVSWLMTSAQYHTACGQLLNYSMLGSDKVCRFNVTRYMPNDYYAGKRKLNTEFASSDVVVFTLKDLQYVCIPQSTAASQCIAPQRLTNLNIPAKLKLFYFEKATLSQIVNSNFKVGGSGLKIGAGMPLLLSSPFSGDLTISFNYGINRIISTKDPNPNEIKLSVKKSTFDSEDNGKPLDFWEGSLNGTSCRLINQVVDNVEKNVIIVIEDVKEGDDVWLRLAPTITGGGYYANINNLKMSMEVK